MINIPLKQLKKYTLLDTKWLATYDIICHDSVTLLEPFHHSSFSRLR